MKGAVVGVGRMGCRHVQVIRDLGLELVGICDSRADALAAAAKEAGIPPALQFSDPGTMLKASQPDCVVVATTAPAHCELVCLAAEHGVKCVLCEKPMAVSLAECDRMIKCCQERGTRLAINHQMRFMEQYTEPKRIAESEAFGGLSSVTVVAGNFGIAMNGTHYFEMFRFMTGEAPLGVTAWFSPERFSNPRGPQFEDRAGAVRLRTASGKRFYMEVGADQGHGVKVVYAGRFGQIAVDEVGGTMTVSIRQEGFLDLPTTRYGMPAVETMHQIAPADAITPSRSVLDALLRGTDAPTGEAGRLAVAVLVAAYVSNETGHVEVRVDDSSLPLERTFPWA